MSNNNNKTKRLSKKKINKFLNGAGLFTNTNTNTNTPSTPDTNTDTPTTTTAPTPTTKTDVLLVESKYDQGEGNEELTKITEEPDVRKILDELVNKANSLHMNYMGSKKGACH